ncbi:MAG: LAGLIDADG family homing endonuclease, partial [Candidatus Micrarchaeota archaeon]
MEEDVSSAFEQFFESAMEREVSEVAAAYPEKRSVEIDFRKLEEFNPDLADGLAENPDEHLAQAEKALENSRFASLLASPEAKKFRPHVRVCNLRTPQTTVQFLGSEHLNKLVKADGVISWITQISPRMKTAVWECLHCEHRIKTATDKHAIKQPRACQCGRSNFKLVEESSDFVNVQRANMQDLVENLRGNVPTTHVELWMEDDIVNQIAPGEKITVTGILRLRPVKEGKGRSSVYAKFLDVVHLEKKEEDFEALEIAPEEEAKILELSKDKRLYEKIVKSIAPGVFGYDEMKQAIALQLFGGTPNKFLPDGQRIRSDLHALLIGDPGCLVADERVVMGNGAIERIADLGERHLQEISLPLLTGQGYKRDTATVFHSYPQQLIMEIITDSGKSIKGTFNHPLLTIHKRERKWKRLDQIKVGERVATVPWIPCAITRLLETDWKPQPYTFGPRSKIRLPKLLDTPLAGLLGYAVGDGWVTRTQLGLIFNPEEQDLIPLVQKSLRHCFGTEAKVQTRKRPNRQMMTVLALHSVDAAANLQFLREKRVPKIVMRSGNKVAAEFLAWLFDADGCVFSHGRGKRSIQLKSSSIELLRDVQMLLLRFAVHAHLNGNNLCIRRAQSIRKYAEHVGFRSKKKKIKLRQLVRDCTKLHHERGKELSERVVAVRPAGVADVFDVEIPAGHRFIANGIISHNTSKSTLLSYVSRLAPKCIMVGGKSASSVGLTASAEKDEVSGGWILKAGAMVLANGGMVCVDELDKMDDEDRAAMHQALEQQVISVAKAGIISQFQARTAVLAAANPKYGRFDPNALPAQQFELSPTLLSVDAEEPVLVRENGVVKLAPIAGVVDRYYPPFCGRPADPVFVKGLEVACFNSDFKTMWKPVSYVFRHPVADDLLELRLETGRRVRVTPGHSVFVFENGGVAPKKTAEIRKGDYVVVPKKLPSNCGAPDKINLAAELAKLGGEAEGIFLHGVPPSVFKRVKDVPKHWVRQAMLPVRCAALFSDEELSSCGLKCKGGSAKTVPCFVPVDGRLMRLLGYYLAEGSLFVSASREHLVSLSFGDKDDELIADASRCA